MNETFVAPGASYALAHAAPAASQTIAIATDPAALAGQAAFAVLPAAAGSNVAAAGSKPLARSRAPPARARTRKSAVDSAAEGTTARAIERDHPPLAELPTQQGPRGIRFDFNDGCRVMVPEAEHPWRVRISDLDTGNVLFDTVIKAGRVNSTKRYYVRFRLEVWQHNEKLLEHDYGSADRDVLIRFAVETLGDTLGWFSYAVKFKEQHHCRLTCVMNERLAGLLRDSYPDITFLSENEVDPEHYYASYTIAVYFTGNGAIYEHADRVPCDFRFVGLHRAAGYILGVDPAELPPRIALTEDSRPLAEPYVCIAVQSTMRSKYWNNPAGWHEIVAFLKEAGYRVICIDQKSAHGKGLVWEHMPAGAEDQTGDRPLLERARWLKHAEFFVGLSSGLSWLAWSVGTPVVMISGFTHPLTEFATPYRVINYHACNSCWNDPQAVYNRNDFLTCPRHQDTPRQFECSRLITAAQVKAAIGRIPQFAAMSERRAAATQAAAKLGEALPHNFANAAGGAGL